MLRWLPFALVCALAAVPAAMQAASADPPVFGPRHSIYRERPEGMPFRQRYAGAIDGRVVAVDYRSGTVTVRTRRGLMDVVILPSTSIQAERSGFHTIADIVRGERVHVLMSRRGDNFIAQIVNLKNR